MTEMTFLFEDTPEKKYLLNYTEDFPKLAVQLTKFHIISKEVSDRFKYLDLKHLEPDTALRYLFQQMCKSIKEGDKAIIGKLGRVQNRLEERNSYVCDAIMKELGRVQGAKTCSKEDANAEECLSLSDVADLTETLTEGSKKWEQIGIALKVPSHIRDDCSKGSCNVIKLCNILTAWISGDYNDSKPATLEYLEFKLRSNTVDLNVLASKLHKLERNKESLPPPKEEKDPKLEVDYQSDDTEVDIEKSTLLEVQVVQVRSKGCEYQWSKDGQRLLDGAEFSGVSTNILYINKASEGSEGKYSCCVSNGSESVCTYEINLRLIVKCLLDIKLLSQISNA